MRQHAMEQKRLECAVPYFCCPPREKCAANCSALPLCCPKPSKTHVNWDLPTGGTLSDGDHPRRMPQRVEITFEDTPQQHHSMPSAVLCQVTGNKEYIARYGLEVMMIAICRFWSQRVSYSQAAKICAVTWE